MPANKTPDQCTVSELRDFVAARGGKISGRKPELVNTVKSWQFIEAQVSKPYIDRNPNPNGILYAKIDTSGTRPIGEILDDLHEKVSASDGTDIHSLIRDSHLYYEQGLFDDKYDNISRVAPETKESFIYLTYAHIGSSVKEKNIGDSLRRCWYENETAYHGIALLPDEHKVIIMSKAHASMARDEKTRKETEEGEPPKKMQYLVLMELHYRPTNKTEDGHNLGIFTRIDRSYCGGCVAGSGSCRHRSERLWYQFHHWTPDRLGIDRPSTLGVCSWALGGKALNCDVCQNIHKQQLVKYEPTLSGQRAKLERGAKRDCTEGISCNYEVHMSDKKRKPLLKQFEYERTKPLWDLLRKQSSD